MTDNLPVVADTVQLGVIAASTTQALVAECIAQDDCRRAWLAGFIDGEGSIGVSRYRDPRPGRPGTYGYRAAIQINNTHRGSIEWARVLMCAPPTAVCQMQPATERHAAQYHINVRNPRNVAFNLARILPFLRIKEQQARLVMEFCRSRLAVRGRGRYAKFTEREAAIFAELRTLNRRGPK